MSLTALAIVAAQGGAMPPLLRCQLVTPGGEAVNFLVPGQNAAVGVADILPSQGTAWPVAAVAGSWERSAPSGFRRALVGGREGIALDVQDGRPGRRTAILSRRGGGSELPVAFGYCDPLDGVAIQAPGGGRTDAAAAGLNVAAVDPRRWREGCHLMLEGGRRVPLTYTIAGPRGPLTLAAPGLWSGQRVSASINFDNGGRFTSESGPTGAERLAVDQQRGTGVKIIQFTRIGDPAVTEQTGYAICAYPQMQRRGIAQ